MVTERDIEYLRNINTSPGPNAGRSIDPTKPGPDDAAYCHAWAAIFASDELKNARRKLSIHEFRLIIRAALTGSTVLDAEPVAWQFRFKDVDGGWDITERPDYWRKQPNAEVRPLFAAPPRPDEREIEPSKRWGYPDEDD